MHRNEYMTAAENLRPGDTFVSSRWNGSVFTRTVKSIHVGNQFGRRVAHVVTEYGTEHIPAGKLMEMTAEDQWKGDHE